MVLRRVPYAKSLPLLFTFLFLLKIASSSKIDYFLLNLNGENRYIYSFFAFSSVVLKFFVPS